MAETYDQYPHIDRVIPAMGYSPEQIRDLEATINACDVDLVLYATPIDLPSLIRIDKPSMRVRYEYQVHDDGPTLKEMLGKRLEATNP